eukprot:2385273-Pyramimonas_sp.AAC.1
MISALLSIHPGSARRVHLLRLIGREVGRVGLIVRSDARSLKRSHRDAAPPSRVVDNSGAYHQHRPHHKHRSCHKLDLPPHSPPQSPYHPKGGRT